MRNRLLFSKAFREAIASDPLLVVDVGARGRIEEPWASMEEGVVHIVGFEPDEHECRRLNAEARAGEQYVPAALWSSSGEVDVHVADFPGCSSVHPPNFELLERYREEHWKPRVTRSIARYRATTLDAALADSGSGCDFIKIDTQGAEFEVLSGASETLECHVFGVLVETWTVDIHSGQRLTGDILNLMTGYGFHLFDVNVAAAWRRHVQGDVDPGGKRQVVGLDLLFFRNCVPRSDVMSDTKLFKAAAIADIYGFPDYALEILDSSKACAGDTASANRLREQILASSAKQQPPSGWQRIRRRFSRSTQREDFASLHY
jgi:FkbM family methyltransferase